MKSHLKVKVFALSAEMSYIHRQEHKWKNKARYARQKVADFARVANALHVEAQRSVDYAESNFWSQRNHRKFLKLDARTAHLAYGCMRGVPYSKMEVLCYGPLKGFGSSEPDWKAIEQMVERFAKDEPSPQDYMQRFAEWITEAKKWYEGNEKRILQAAESRALWKARLERSTALKDNPEFNNPEKANEANSSS